MASLFLELPIDWNHHGFRVFQSCLATLTRFPDNIWFAAHKDHLEVFTYRKTTALCSFKFPRKLFTHYDVRVRKGCGVDENEPKDFLHALVPARSVVGSLIIDKKNHAASGGTLQMFLLDENQQSTHVAGGGDVGAHHPDGGADGGCGMDELDRTAGTDAALVNKGTRFRPRANPQQQQQQNPAAAAAAAPRQQHLAAPTMMCIQINQKNGVQKHLNLKLISGAVEWLRTDLIEAMRSCTFSISAKKMNSVVSELPNSDRLVLCPHPERFRISTAELATEEASAAGGGANSGGLSTRKAVNVGMVVNDNFKVVVVPNTSEDEMERDQHLTTQQQQQQTQQGQQQRPQPTGKGDLLKLMSTKSVCAQPARRFMALGAVLPGYELDLNFTKNQGPMHVHLHWTGDTKRGAVPTTDGVGGGSAAPSGNYGVPASINHFAGGNAYTMQNNSNNRGIPVTSQQQHFSYNGGTLPQMQQHLQHGEPDNQEDHMYADIVLVTSASETLTVSWPKQMVRPVKKKNSITDQDPILAGDTSRGDLPQQDDIPLLQPDVLAGKTETPARRDRDDALPPRGGVGGGQPAPPQQNQQPPQQQQQQHRSSSDFLALQSSLRSGSNNNSNNQQQQRILTGSELHMSGSERHPSSDVQLSVQPNLVQHQQQQYQQQQQQQHQVAYTNNGSNNQAMQQQLLSEAPTSGKFPLKQTPAPVGPGQTSDPALSGLLMSGNQQEEHQHQQHSQFNPTGHQQQNEEEDELMGFLDDVLNGEGIGGIGNAAQDGFMGDGQFNNNSMYDDDEDDNVHYGDLDDDVGFARSQIRR